MVWYGWFGLGGWAEGEEQRPSTHHALAARPNHPPQKGAGRHTLRARVPWTHTLCVCGVGTNPSFLWGLCVQAAAAPPHSPPSRHPSCIQSPTPPSTHTTTHPPTPPHSRALLAPHPPDLFPRETMAAPPPSSSSSSKTLSLAHLKKPTQPPSTAPPEPPRRCV